MDSAPGRKMKKAPSRRKVGGTSSTGKLSQGSSTNLSNSFHSSSTSNIELVDDSPLMAASYHTPPDNDKMGAHLRPSLKKKKSLRVISGSNHSNSNKNSLSSSNHSNSNKHSNNEAGAATQECTPLRGSMKKRKSGRGRGLSNTNHSGNSDNNNDDDAAESNPNAREGDDDDSLPLRESMKKKKSMRRKLGQKAGSENQLQSSGTELKSTRDDMNGYARNSLSKSEHSNTPVSRTKSFGGRGSLKRKELSLSKIETMGNRHSFAGVTPFLVANGDEAARKNLDYRESKLQARVETDPIEKPVNTDEDGELSIGDLLEPDEAEGNDFYDDDDGPPSLMDASFSSIQTDVTESVSVVSRQNFKRNMIVQKSMGVADAPMKQFIGNMTANSLPTEKPKRKKAGKKVRPQEIPNESEGGMFEVFQATLRGAIEEDIDDDDVLPTTVNRQPSTEDILSSLPQDQFPAERGLVVEDELNNSLPSIATHERTITQKLSSSEGDLKFNMASSSGFIEAPEATGVGDANATKKVKKKKKGGTKKKKQTNAASSKKSENSEDAAVKDDMVNFDAWAFHGAESNGSPEELDDQGHDPETLAQFFPKNPIPEEAEFASSAIAPKRNKLGMDSVFGSKGGLTRSARYKDRSLPLTALRNRITKLSLFQGSRRASASAADVGSGRSEGKYFPDAHQWQEEQFGGLLMS